ncbi:LPXTG cell wall anchor domain-containing protein [Actinoplanes sp. CA-030573]|uniref:LPXTG cell wall anchor domain-containing protein n=1 Tax=Actinoplanes sp. CA-030573 TaxID=3239898 RepID=UPI003D902DEE
MNLFTTKLRRGATVAGGTFLGLGIVAAMAAPALACSTVVRASGECGDDGGWVAAFQVANDWDRADGVIASVKIDDEDYTDAIGEIQQGKVAPRSGDYRDESTYVWLKGSLKEAADKENVRLTITMTWDGKNPITKSDTATKPENCGGESTPPTTPTTEPTTEPSSPETTEPTTAPTTTPATTSPTPTATTPTETPTVPVPTPSESGEPVLPNEIFDVDCDSMTIGLDNTKGEIEYKLHFAPSKGEAKDLDIKAGEKKSATFQAEEGFSVKLTVVASYQGVTSPPETVTVPFEKPAGCGGAGGGGGDELAKTGTPTAGIAGGAAALLAVGGGLFYLARRRKVKFTA